MTTYRILSKTGRCSNGYHRDGGVLYHAVTGEWGDWEKALCGTVPGKRGNGWSAYPGTDVTCPKCLAKLEAASRQP